MAIDIKFDLTGNPEPPTILLAKRNGDILGQLNIDNNSIEMSDKFNDASEFSFTMYKNNIDFSDEELNLYNEFLVSSDDFMLQDSNGLFLVVRSSDNTSLIARNSNGNGFVMSKELYQHYLWDNVVDFKLVYCKEWDEWFQISVKVNEEDEIVKTVICTQLEKSELSQLNLYNVEINTEKDIERPDYKISILYNNEDAEASILNRLLKDKAPHYSIAHVDYTIASIQRSFSFDKISIDDAFQEIAEEIGCVFIYHTYKDENKKLKRTISIYDLQQNCNDCGHRGEFTDICPKCGSKNIEYGYGEDTLIFVTSDELASSGIELTTDVDSVKNCFKLEAGDDLMTATIRSCNPNGTDYMWRISDDTKKDMSDELVGGIDSYNKIYQRYYNTEEFRIDSSLLNNYNKLIEDYSKTNEDLQKISSPMVGYSSLMKAYYDSIDFSLYLESSMMPNIKISKTSASEQARLLTSSSLPSVAVTDVSIASLSTVDNTVLAMAKIIVKSTYKVQINTSELSDNGNNKIWKGNFVVTSYSDEEDTATSSTISVSVNDDLESYIQQKIDKALNKENTDDLSISGLFKLDYDKFCKELKNYALNPLISFREACQACIDIMIKQGVANGSTWSDNEEGSEGNLYEKLYVPYYNKLKAIESEIKIREDEIAIVSGIYDLNGNLTKHGVKSRIEEIKNDVQDILNFEKHLNGFGDGLWLEFCSYRREDTYSNENYISDGLDNAEIFKKAFEFIEVAEDEIYKASELQHSISTQLNNLLAIPKFKKLKESFKVGNWLRIQIDNVIYKLRLLEYKINFGDFDNIPVVFSDVAKIKNGITDIHSIIKQSSSMATTFDSVKRQSQQGNEAKGTIQQWTQKGLNSALVQIQSNDSEEITLTKNGLLCRSYDDVTDSYSPKQLKLTHNIMAYTDNNWESVRLAIGEHEYTSYDTESKSFVNKVGYGISADFVTAGVVSGSQIIGGDIYSDNYSIIEGTGSYLNLRDGTFSFGGGALSFDGTKLWLNSPDIPTNENIEATATQITADYLKTTDVYAENLRVNAAYIEGELTASQINTEGLIAENIFGDTITGKNISGGSLLIGDKTGTYAEITSDGTLTCVNGNFIGNITGSSFYAEGTVVKYASDYTEDDLTICQDIIIRKRECTVEDMEKYDIDGDGILSAKDLLRIQKFLLGDETEYSYETYIKINPANSTNLIQTEGVSIGLSGIFSENINVKSATFEKISVVDITKEDNNMFVGLTGEYSIGDTTLNIVNGIIVGVI